MYNPIVSGNCDIVQILLALSILEDVYSWRAAREVVEFCRSIHLRLLMGHRLIRASPVRDSPELRTPDIDAAIWVIGFDQLVRRNALGADLDDLKFTCRSLCGPMMIGVRSTADQLIILVSSNNDQPKFTVIRGRYYLDY